MKKMILLAPATVEYKDIRIPKISDEEVLIKIINCGICGSDIHVYWGLSKVKSKYPRTQGHEVGAIVVKSGKNVKGYKIGDRVTVRPQIICGKCYPCKIGRYNVCEQFKPYSVFFTEYAAVPYQILHSCPKDMDFEKIALVEPLAVGIASVRRSNFQGKNVCVFGAGTIGNFAAQAAKCLGADKVMIVDKLQKKLDIAKSCGIKMCFNNSKNKLKEGILQLFGEQRADVIIDTAGSVSGFYEILEAARNSSEIVITANYNSSIELNLPRIQRSEISIIGHMMYVYKDFEDSIQLLYKNKIISDYIITDRFPFEKYQEAMDYIKTNPDTVKVMLNIGKLD